MIPFFYAVATRVDISPGTSLSRIVFSRGNRGFAFCYPRIIAVECDVCRWCWTHGPRLAFPRRYPSWTAYYSRVPISTRAIALLHLGSVSAINCASSEHSRRPSRISAVSFCYHARDNECKTSFRLVKLLRFKFVFIQIELLGLKKSITLYM